MQPRANPGGGHAAIPQDTAYSGVLAGTLRKNGCGTQTGDNKLIGDMLCHLVTCCRLALAKLNSRTLFGQQCMSCYCMVNRL